MNFIWDIILQAEKDGFSRDALFYRQAETPSPYYEHSFPIINQKWVESPLVEINSLYRFSLIFEELLHPDVLRGLRYGDIAYFVYYFFDTIVHYIGEIDLRHGLTRREFYVRALRREILDGAFSNAAAEAMAVMDRALQLKLADEVLTQMQTGSCLYRFRKAILAAFPDCLLYQSNYESSQLYLYIGKPESQVRAKILGFALEGFLPLGFSVKVFWQHHFGILGVDATMPSNGIAIF